MERFAKNRTWIVLLIAAVIVLSALLLYIALYVDQSKTLRSVEIIAETQPMPDIDAGEVSNSSNVARLYEDSEYKLPTFSIKNNDVTYDRPSAKDISGTQAADCAVEIVEKLYDTDLSGAAAETSFENSYVHENKRKSVWSVDIAEKDGSYSYGVVINSVTGKLLEVYKLGYTVYEQEYAVYDSNGDNIGIEEYYRNIYKYSEKIKDTAKKWLETDSVYVASIDSQMWLKGNGDYSVYTPCYYIVTMSNGNVYEFEYTEESGLVSIYYYEDAANSYAGENTTRIYSAQSSGE